MTLPEKRLARQGTLQRDLNALIDHLAGGGAGGEVNTASNVGSAGVGWYDGKVGADLQFRKADSLHAGLTIALDAINQKVDFCLSPTYIDHNALLNYAANQHVALPSAMANVLTDHNLAAHTALGLFSASSQVDHNATTNYVANQHVALPGTITNVLTDHNLAAHTALGLFSVSYQIDHNATLNYAANQHIDWTAATSNLATTGSVRIGDSPLYLRGGTDANHYIRWMTANDRTRFASWTGWEWYNSQSATVVATLSGAGALAVLANLSVGMADTTSPLNVYQPTAGGVAALLGRWAPTLAGSSYVADNSVNFSYGLDDDAGGGWLNYVGYQNGVTRFRDLYIGDGKKNLLSLWDGSSGLLTHNYGMVVNETGNALGSFRAETANKTHGIWLDADADRLYLGVAASPTGYAFTNTCIGESTSSTGNAFSNMFELVWSPASSLSSNYKYCTGYVARFDDLNGAFTIGDLFAQICAVESYSTALARSLTGLAVTSRVGTSGNVTTVTGLSVRHFGTGSGTAATYRALYLQSPYLSNGSITTEYAIYQESVTGINHLGGKTRMEQALEMKDGVSAPAALAGYARIYVDSADGDLKVKFADGVTKTIATDT